MEQKLKIAIEAALAGGVEIMKVYESEDFQVESKEDNSPLTVADKNANDIINEYLISTGIPIISEENRQLPFEDRKNWNHCWIVDPLDGTKEFIKKNGEFTVNIALIEKGKPVLGVIFAPALNILYFAVVPEKKAFKTDVPIEFDVETLIKNSTEIKPCASGEILKIVGSRSHMNEETLQFIASLESETGKKVEIVSKGSSLKFCLVAEGAAHIYPRFAPTMEWDTAAGQAICEAVGVKVCCRETGNPIQYNRKELLNGHFLVSYER